MGESGHGVDVDGRVERARRRLHRPQSGGRHHEEDDVVVDR